MQINFRLPSLGADMESAILTEWLKKPGDPIRRGEALAVVETAKGLIDIESFEEGTVAKLLVGPGTTVPVGAVLAHIESVSAESAPPAVPSVGVPGAALASAAEGLTTPAPERMSQTDSSLATTRRRPVSPAARRRADELGITLAALEQASPGGVIHIADVEKLAARELPDRHRAMRTSIGTAMARSKREIPHYYLGHTVDFGTARAWLQRYNSQVPVAERLIEGVLLLKAVALTAAQCFGFNGYFRARHGCTPGHRDCITWWRSRRSSPTRRESQGSGDTHARVQRPCDARAQRPHALWRIRHRHAYCYEPWQRWCGRPLPHH